ncbi:MAG: hypothetical protein M3P49_09735 [Actinomycetota bacterium]|nr:hypothetical protein [Actinomycetota bacterium]
MDKTPYGRDVRGEPQTKRAAFRRGWRDAVSYERAPYTEETLRDRLTWQNLGYRLGALFDTAGSEADPDMIDEMFEWCVKRYRDLSVRQRRGMGAQGSLGGERGPVGDPRSAGRPRTPTGSGADNKLLRFPRSTGGSAERFVTRELGA